MMAKRGRPTKQTPEMIEQAYKLCLLGATNSDLAEFFGVATSTVKKWMAEGSEFSAAIKKGKTIADARVAERLFERAMGYSHPEEKIFCHEGEITRAETTKHYPPETTAAIFWLKNRQPEKWRDAKQIDANINHAPLPKEEQLRQAKELLDGVGLDEAGVGEVEDTD